MGLQIDTENSQENGVEISNGRTPAKDIGWFVMQKGAIVERPDGSCYHGLSIELPGGVWIEFKYTGLDPYFEPHSELLISIGGAVIKNAPKEAPKNEAGRSFQRFHKKISGTWVVSTSEINFDGEPKIEQRGVAPENIVRKAHNYEQWLADSLLIIRNVNREARYVVTSPGDLVAEPFRDRIMQALARA